MIANRKVTGTAASLPGGLAIGAAVSIVTTVLVSAISAHLISSELLAQENIGYCAIAALVCSTILGAWMAVARIKRQKFAVSLLSGLIYYLVLLSVTALFFGGQYRGMGVTLIIVALASVAAALITGRGGKQPHPKRRKKSYR